MTLGKPEIMGVLNVTPDSFSDGGRYRSAAEAIEAGLKMVEEGAAIIDVGGESTRPGAEDVPFYEELSRVMPVVSGLCAHRVRVSIDTSKAKVAQEALSAGATMVNDVTAFADPEMAGVCARFQCQICLMHMQGEPRTMQLHPTYRDVVEEVAVYLLQRAKLAEKSGITPANIFIDPGIGFGKTDAHNLSLIKQIGKFVELSYPILLGVSRKGFIGRLIAEDGGTAPLAERVVGGLAIQAYALLQGVSMLRTHDVKPAAELSKTLGALLSAT